MLLYRDVLNNDELFSDAYKVNVQDDGFIVTVDAKVITTKGETVSADLIGGNPSAEDGGDDEGLDDPEAKTGLDVAFAHELEDQSAFFTTKKVLQSYLKTYVKNLAGHLGKEDQEQCDTFKKQAAEKLKTSFLDKFDPKEDTIYCGASFDPTENKSSPMICKWNEDGMSATFIVLKHATAVEKI